MTPGDSLVKGFIKACIGSGYEMFPIIRVDPKGVIITMLFPTGGEVVKGFTSVPGDVEKDIHLIDQIRIYRGSLDFLVVMRSSSSRCVAVAMLPTFTFIRRSVKPFFLGISFDGGIYDVRICRGDRNANLSHVTLW